MNEILKIINLNISYMPNVFAVNNVNLEITEPAFISLVGQSGSGKSTLALSISGDILIQHKEKQSNVLRFSKEEFRQIRGKKIGFVFQDPGSSLNPVMKVGDQIAEAYAVHHPKAIKESRRVALEWLPKERISEPERVYGSYPHQISGGMKQRAMIAMALVAGPDILVSDEPTTALDPVNELEVMQLLSELQKSGKLSVIFVTHDINLALKYSDKIFVMEHGRILERLEKSHNFESKNAYTQRLLKASLLGLKNKEMIPV